MIDYIIYLNSTASKRVCLLSKVLHAFLSTPSKVFKKRSKTMLLLPVIRESLLNTYPCRFLRPNIDWSIHGSFMNAEKFGAIFHHWNH